jgi:transposase
MSRGPREIRGPGGALALRPEDVAAWDLAMLIAGETSGRPLQEILAEFGRSRSSYYEKLQRFREGGLAALAPRPCGPRGPWRRPLTVVSRIVSARLRDPALPVETIAAELQQQGVRISVRSVERTLAEFGLTRRGSAG